MREIYSIIIHCAASKGDISAKTIDRMHRMRGWKGIGYHYLIRRNGNIELGRPLSEQGAHVKGHNQSSIGICLAGGLAAEGEKGVMDYTLEQWETLGILVRGLQARFPSITLVAGHNEFTKKKTCPNFDVAAWAARGYMPPTPFG